MRETELISDIRDPGVREEFFQEVYEKAFPGVARFVSHHGGSFDQARDIFQDALVILYEKIVNDQIVIESSYEAYLMGISKHLWIRKFKTESRHVFFENDLELSVTLPEDFFAVQSGDNRLLRLLELTGKKCLELLKAFYYDSRSLREISDAFGFSGERSATVQKHKCIEKIRSTVKSKSIHYGDLSE